MNARRYLEGIKEYREKKERLKAQLDELSLNYESMTGIDYSTERVQKSPKNSMEDAAWKMLKKCDRVNKEIDKCDEEIEERLDMIERIEPPLYRMILYKVYAEYKSMAEVSIEMNYSYNYACTKHIEGLEKIGERLR